MELTEQIPYYHPSQLKLAQLLHYLSMSPMFMLGTLTKYTKGPMGYIQTVHLTTTTLC